jgi:hypothetical protein
MSNSTIGSTIDNEVGNLEQAIADIFAVPVNTDIKGQRACNRLSTIADSTTLTNPTVYTAFSQTYSVPAGSLVAGDIIRVRVALTSVRGATGTISRKIRLGALDIFVRTGGSAIAATYKEYVTLDALVVAIGATGSVRGVIGTDVEVTGGGFTGVTEYTAITVDTTGALTLDVQAQFNTSHASNTIKITSLAVEVIPAFATA